MTMSAIGSPEASFLDAHCHCFTEAHLTKADPASRLQLHAYTLREHLDGLLATAGPQQGIVVVNVALSALPTSQHVIDSFDELTRLQTLYGTRYSRVSCILGTVRADEANAATLLANPLVIGARCFLATATPASAAEAVSIAPFHALRTHDKYMELLAMDLATLHAAVRAIPSDIALMIDHLGAWAAPPLAEYRALLATLASRTGRVLLKGPGHRTSEFPPVVAEYVAAAIGILGPDGVLLSATDAPHVFAAKELFRGRFVCGPLGLVARLGEQLTHGGAVASAAQAVLRYVPTEQPVPCGMIHAPQPQWYAGEDLMIPVGPASMHAVVFRPMAAVSGHVAKKQRCEPGLICIVGSGYTGFLGLYPALMCQALARENITGMALEYPGYGASTGRGENEVSIANQADAFRAAASYARQCLGATRVVGVAWAMGSAALVQASLDGGFSGVALLNALLDAPRVHRHVISSVNAARPALEALVQNHGLADDVKLPPASYDEFAAMVSAMRDEGLYPGFQGYPLDARTLDVVIRQLYAHEGYAVPHVRGRFWKELAATSLGNVQLSCPALLVHGELNELHTVENVKDFAATNDAPLKLLPQAKHNDFMRYGNASFDEMMAHIAAFAVNVRQ